MTSPEDGSVPTDRRVTMPSLDLLRSLTDEHVLRELMAHGRLTRAEIAARTGISKPTVSESVRRLSAARVLVDTGERTSGRGRAGSYYTLSDTAGTALVLSIRPDGVSAEAVDPSGTTVDESLTGFDRGAGPDEVARAMVAAARQVTADRAPFRVAVVSAADPVDRSTGRLVQLPDAPLLVGNLDPVSILSAMVAGPVLVDNDVNWAARAERDAGEGPMDDFVYLHLGEGLGCAVVTDGDVTRGHNGLAGEIAHLLTVGPEGVAMPLTEVFARLGLRRTGTTAIDVDRLLARLAEPRSGGLTTLQAVARALSGVVAAAIALADPEQVVIGGSWGLDPRVTAALTECLAVAPRAVPLRAAIHADHPDHLGARMHGLAELRTMVATRQ
jgi:predicted NBD/HSP70 family sugar kinase